MNFEFKKQIYNYNKLTGGVGAAAYKRPNLAELQPIQAYIYFVEQK